MNGLRSLAGALALCCLSVMAVAADAPCASRAALMDFISSRFPRTEVRLLQKTEAQAFLAAIIRIAPAASLAADEIVIVDQALDAPFVRVALFEKGCLTRIGNLPRAVVGKILVSLARGSA